MSRAAAPGAAPAAPGRADDRAAAVEILARTLLGEAGGRPVRAIEAVAAVVMNRVRLAAAPGGPAHWGRGIAGVCRAPFQFACWLPRHPRHRAMLEAGEGDAALALCRRVAARAAAGALPDPTGGATHYHDAATLPRWAVGAIAQAEIGGLVFYRLGPAPA
ncbi:cell wall hydrolase [Caldovatus aquaticus]|uniref:Cell wall hydrolase n=1 Tax=Caldovatus aquaticus TaxID=2865671 RepID=A0ABS7F470_9PROT|nr:cell wall hydrolase [Caldovatus aquaticus]MBW8270374.1 cell wall hydrolase [Caldovatus aquaticus]